MGVTYQVRKFMVKDEALVYGSETVYIYIYTRVHICSLRVVEKTLILHRNTLCLILVFVMSIINLDMWLFVVLIYGFVVL